jgi:hypothetical protein
MGGFEISHEQALKAVTAADKIPGKSRLELRFESMEKPKVSFTRFM